MMRSGWLLVTAFFLIRLVWGQESQKPGGEQEQRPTLGGEPAPTLHGGPRTATVNDYHKLSRVRIIYIERMDNALSEKLVESLGKMGRLRITSKPKEADAIMTGSCLESRRLKRLHSEVFLSDRSGESLWQDNIFRPYNPPSLEHAVDETARVVADHLVESLNQAGSE